MFSIFFIFKKLCLASCMLLLGFQYIRVHAPGATESVTVRSDFVCSLCTSPLQEDMKYRVLGGNNCIVLL